MHSQFPHAHEDVGRLLDTLDDGFAEAGGDELVESGQHALQPSAAGEPPEEHHGDYPQTGHYARPGEAEYGRLPAQGEGDYGQYGTPAESEYGQYATSEAAEYGQYGTPAEGDYQAGQYGTPAEGDYQYGTSAEGDYYTEPEQGLPDERPAPADVLVARGAPAADKLVAGYGTGVESVPRENLIVNDSLQYGQPSVGGYPSDQYATPPPSQGGGPATDPYGFAASEVAEHNPAYSVPSQPGGDPYGSPDHYGGTQPDAFFQPRPRPDAFSGRFADSPAGCLLLRAGRRLQPDAFGPPPSMLSPSRMPSPSPMLSPSRMLSPQPDAFSQPDALDPPEQGESTGGRFPTPIPTAPPGTARSRGSLRIGGPVRPARPRPAAASSGRHGRSPARHAPAPPLRQRLAVRHR